MQYINEKIKRYAVDSDLVYFILKHQNYIDDIIDMIYLENEIKKISKRAQTVIRIILYPKKRELSKLPVRITQNALRLYLKENKWTRSEINQCFKEIMDILYESCKL